MRILVIDDEPLIHISIEKLIQKYSEELPYPQEEFK